MSVTAAVDFMTGEILESVPDMQEWSRERQLAWRLYKENGTKVKTIADEIGVHRTVMSLFINKGKELDAESMQKLRAYLMVVGMWDQDEAAAAEESYIKSVNELPFIITETWKRTWFVLNNTYKAHNFGMVVGPSGCGKTEALRAWLDRPENAEKAIKIMANASMTRASILRRIARALGLSANADADTLIERICQELRERPKMIIFDEADQMNNVLKFETLRSILDGTRNVGIAFIGNEDLRDYIVRLSVNNRKLARIHNRFGAYQTVSMPTRVEARSFLQNINMTQNARDHMVSVICRTGGDGGFRVARTMLNILFEAVGDAEITESLMRSEALKNAVLSETL